MKKLINNIGDYAFCVVWNILERLEALEYYLKECKKRNIDNKY